LAQEQSCKGWMAHQDRGQDQDQDQDQDLCHEEGKIDRNDPHHLRRGLDHPTAQDEAALVDLVLDRALMAASQEDVEVACFDEPVYQTRARPRKKEDCI